MAATTVAFSTTVLIGPGTAQAAVPSWVATASGVQTAIPAGICYVEWTLFGGSGGAASDGTDDGFAGELYAILPATTGDVYTLYPGTAGADGVAATSGAAGGTNGDGVPSDQGTAGGLDSDSGIGAGGGGAASVVTKGGAPIAIAFGGIGSGINAGNGGYDGGNWAGLGAIDGLDYDSTLYAGDLGDGEIYGEGIPCMPSTPELHWVEALDGALRLHFNDGSDGDTDTTGYEYTLDGGSTWTALTGIQDNDGQLTAVISGLTNDTDYLVSLRAVDADADSPPSYESEEMAGTPYKQASAPGNVKAVAADGKVTVSWTASTAGTYDIVGYVVSLRSINQDGQGGHGAQFCDTSSSVFTCTAPAQPGVKHSLWVEAADADGNPGEGVFVTSDVVPAPSTVPESDGALTLPAGATASVEAGKTVTITGSGYQSFTGVTILLYSTPQILTTVVTDGGGSFTATVTVPAGLAVGQHTLVAAGLAPDGTMRYLTLPVTVTGAGAVLANTGADVTAPALGGLTAVVLGTGLLVVARRRPETPAAPAADLAA
jgi:hypothetical protein